MSLYTVLGVTSTASQEDIKKQYRKLSLDCHPDRPNGNSDTFQELNAAYEQLSDVNKRTQYDRQLNPPDDFLNMFFGERTEFDQHSFIFKTMIKAPPLVVTVEITLDQAHAGCNLPVNIDRWINDQQMKQLDHETIYVDILPGMDTNEYIMMPLKGNMGPDGVLGDVRVAIKVINTTKMVRRGLDLWFTQTITLKESLCGFSYDMEYLHDKKMKISNVSGNVVSPYYKHCIPGKGMTRGNQTGQLIIAFDIIFPATLPQSTVEQLQTLI